MQMNLIREEGVTFSPIIYERYDSVFIISFTETQEFYYEMTYHPVNQNVSMSDFRTNLLFLTAMNRHFFSFFYSCCGK